MKTTEFCLATAVLASLIVVAPTFGENAPAVGVILEIRAPAFLAASEGSPPEQLHPKSDVMRKLFAGQRLRCGPGGRLKIGSASGVREIAPAEAWTELGETRELTPEQSRVAQALRRYGSPGGTRGLGSAVYSPADGASAIPATLVIRWSPPGTPSKVSLRIETESGAVLWSEDGVATASGSLVSGAARRALQAWRSDGNTGDLILGMTDSLGLESRVVFALLSQSQEEALAKDLASWESVGDPLLRSIGRAWELGRRRLLVEAAGEIEAALARAPESRELLEAAIEANRRIGNDPRARELRKRLRPEG